MTYNNYQTKLTEAFKKLSNLSIQIKTAKNEKDKLLKELQEYQKGKLDYTSVFDKIKSADLVDILKYVEAKTNLVKIEETLKKSQIDNLVIDQKINKLKLEIEKNKLLYKELEDSLKASLDNILVLNENK
jgi:hypothetical protein